MAQKIITMKKRKAGRMNTNIKLPLLLLLLATITTLTVAEAADLSTYPSPFVSQGKFNALIVVGANAPAADSLAATDIATNLQLVVQERVITAALDSEVTAPYKQHLILIGDCGSNALIADVKNSSSCYQFANETGVLELIETKGITALIIGGKTATARRKAARSLAQYKTAKLSGGAAYVAGTISSPQVKYEEPELLPPEQQQLQQKKQNESKQTLNKPRSCETDNDCEDDEFCTVQGCTKLDCPPSYAAKNHGCETAEKTQQQQVSSDAEKQQQTIVETERKEEPKKQNILAKILSWFRKLLS